MRIFAGLLLAASAFAAEPDWATLDKYATDLLQRYLRIQSISPPSDTRETSKLIKSELEKHGFTVKLIETGPAGQTNVLLRMAGRDRSRKPLLLLNHQDVVPVDRKAWSVDPFAGLIRDGYIWGRGALDMKGLGVQQMVALIAMKQAGVTPSRDIVMLSTSDEEMSGQYGIRWMIANQFSEIDAEFVIDEGGAVSRDLLSNDKLVFGVSVGEKQMLWLKLTARGTAAHGSQPIPDNANSILLKALGHALDLPKGAKPQQVVAEMQKNIGPMAENKFTAAIQRNTISLTTLRSGVGDPPKVNVIPSVAEATLDCRLLPGVNADEFISEIRARINDPRVTVERMTNIPDPGASRYDTTLFRAIRAAATKHHENAVVTPMLGPYGTDSVHLRQKGIIAYGLNPMLLDAKTMATMHSDEERIPMDQFLKGIRFFFDVLRSEI